MFEMWYDEHGKKPISKIHLTRKAYAQIRHFDIYTHMLWMHRESYHCNDYTPYLSMGCPL